MHLELLKPLFLCWLATVLVLVISYLHITRAEKHYARSDGTLRPDGAADVAFWVGLDLFFVLPAFVVCSLMILGILINALMLLF